MISDYNVELIRIGKLKDTPLQLLETLRTKFPDIIIQGIQSKYVLNIKHAKRIIEISLAASRSGTLLSNKIETDMLMRFAASRQISEAIGKVGLQKDQDFILIAIGKSPLIRKLVSSLADIVKPMIPFPNNVNFLKKEFKITKKELDSILSKESLEDVLVERSAVLLH